MACSRSSSLICMINSAERAVARAQGPSFMVWTIADLQLTLSMIFNLAYSCLFVYIAAASPSQVSFGATNRTARLGVSIVRAPCIRYVHLLAIYQESPPRMDYTIALVCTGIFTSLFLPLQLRKNQP
ncbi:hypothetical protein BDR07DRAFT_92408 [Suillus spraguei]|nr:hypothetical protein BDR07DRAFT_92408 [Suillus spraguei]